MAEYIDILNEEALELDYDEDDGDLTQPEPIPATTQEHPSEGREPNQDFISANKILQTELSELREQIKALQLQRQLAPPSHRLPHEPFIRKFRILKVAAANRAKSSAKPPARRPSSTSSEEVRSIPKSSPKIVRKAPRPFKASSLRTSSESSEDRYAQKGPPQRAREPQTTKTFHQSRGEPQHNKPSHQRAREIQRYKAFHQHREKHQTFNAPQSSRTPRHLLGPRVERPLQISKIAKHQKDQVRDPNGKLLAPVGMGPRPLDRELAALLIPEHFNYLVFGELNDMSLVIGLTYVGEGRLVRLHRVQKVHQYHLDRISKKGIRPSNETEFGGTVWQKPCMLCERRAYHDPRDCPRSKQERVARVEKLRLCPKCLDRHMGEECKDNVRPVCLPCLSAGRYKPQYYRAQKNDFHHHEALCSFAMNTRADQKAEFLLRMEIQLCQQMPDFEPRNCVELIEIDE